MFLGCSRQNTVASEARNVGRVTFLNVGYASSLPYQANLGVSQAGSIRHLFNGLALEQRIDNATQILVAALQFHYAKYTE